jgi:outer membrane receptor protein involved in Fe transport
VAPDPPLNPVTADNYEIGLYARPFSWLEAELTGYWTNVSNDIFAVSPFGTTGVFFQNIGSTRRQGIELNLRGRWGRTLDAYLNYAYTLATFQTRAEVATPLPPGTETVQPGDVMPLVPQQRLNVGVNYRPWPWLTVSAEGIYVGSQYLRGDETNTQAPLSPYFVVNAGATVRWRSLEGFVRINNLFNAQYETFGTFAVNGNAPGNPVEPFLNPAPPINVLVGLKYTF